MIDIQAVEKRIISLLVRKPELIYSSSLRKEDFSIPALRGIFESIMILVQNGAPIDLCTIADHIKIPTPAGYLVRLVRENPAAESNFGHYCKALHKGIKDRRLLSVMATLQEKIISAEITSDDAVAEIIRMASDEAQGPGGAGTEYTAGESMGKTIEHFAMIEEKIAKKESIGVLTGIKKLDQALGGMHKSDLIIVGGRPSMGKTSFAISIALNAGWSGFSVGFISAEMGIEQIGGRMASQVSGVPACEMRDGKVDEDGWNKLSNATANIAKLDFMTLDIPHCTLGDISRQAWAWKMRGEAGKGGKSMDILFIDYLTRITIDNPKDSMMIGVGKIVVGLKSLARSLQIPIVCLAQLSRSVEHRIPPIPGMYDLRETGKIEEEADQVILLYRPCVYDSNADPTEAHAIISKNRHGDIMTLVLRFSPKTMRWSG